MRVLGAAVAMVVLATACAAAGDRDRDQAGDRRLRVVTTVSPLTNIAANVAGDLVEIRGVVPEGTNSHTFEPAPSVARTLARADVIYVNGLQLEVPTLKLARENLAGDAEIVSLGERTIERREYIYDFSFPRDEGKPNPHLWTHPLLALRYAEIIKDDLSDRLPEHAERFQSNYDKLAERVEAFDAALREATGSVPDEDRKLLTYHDSFAYFAEEYGWTVVGAIQPSDFEEPTPRDVAKLIDQVRGEDVPAIFGSEVFPSPVLEQIGREAGVRYVDTLRDDDLPGRPGDPNHSLLGLLQADYVTIVTALGGDAAALRALDVGNVTVDTADYPQ